MNEATFRTRVVPVGNATGAEVPAAVVNAFGAGRRPPVTIWINAHTWRSRVASKDGKLIVGISAANRTAAGIAEATLSTSSWRSTPSRARWTSRPTWPLPSTPIRPFALASIVSRSGCVASTSPTSRGPGATRPGSGGSSGWSTR